MYTRKKKIDKQSYYIIKV